MRESDSQERVDWLKWRAKHQAPLWQLVAISLDYDPQSMIDLEEFDPIDLVQAAGYPPQFTDLLEIAESQVGGDGNLPFVEIVESARGRRYNTVVCLEDFALWMMVMRHSYPEKVPALPSEFPRPSLGTRSKESAAEAKPMGNRERQTLLTIIIALAVRQKVPLTDVSRAAQSIERATEEIDHRVSARTIQDILKKARDLALLPEEV